MDTLNPIITPNPMHNNWLLGDWIELSDGQFVSPPTSIRNIMNAFGYANWQPPGGPPPIPYGTFTFSSYFMDPGQVEIHFRLSGIPIYPSHTRSYFIRYGTDLVTSVYRYESPTTTFLGFMDYLPTPDTWDHLLLVWTPSCHRRGTPAFQILLMKWIADAWVSQGIVWDPQDKWRDEEENRFAFDLYTDAADTWCYFDDTRLELWEGSIITP